MEEIEPQLRNEPVTFTKGGTEQKYEHKRKNTRTRTFSFTRGDDEILKYITDYLGTSNSEAVRSALRAFAAHLAFLQGSRQK